MGFTLKVGQKIQRPGGMVCEIKAVGPTQIAVEASNGTLHVIGDDKWWMYSNYAGFYKVGKTYKFKSLNRADTWQILDVYEVSRPAYDSKVKAVAKMITDRGYEDIQTLSRSDFDRMVEVK